MDSKKIEDAFSRNNNKRLKPEIVKALNDQILIEYNTLQQFQSMWVYCDLMGFTNAAKFFKQGMKEERHHVDKLCDYLLRKNIMPVLPQVPAPKQNYSNLFEVVVDAKNYQFTVTDHYEKIATVCNKVNDATTLAFIQFFLEDQVNGENIFMTLEDEYKCLSQGGVNGLVWRELDRSFKQFID